LRKYLIAAVAAVTAIAFSAVALAQGPDTATLSVKVSPKDAGTKTKPKNSTFTLNVVNNNTSRTMSDLDIFLAKNVKLSLRGMPSCAPDVIAAENCPDSAVLGRGEAKARAGVNGAAPLPLDFVVTAYKTKSTVTGKDMLGFYIDGPGQLNFLTETQLTKASGKYGQKLHIDVPDAAQRTGATSYNGLVSLKATLKKKVGRKYLISTIGCAKGKHPYKVDLTFIPNGVTDGRVISDTANAKCTK
jgi:hypothetical protein